MAISENHTDIINQFIHLETLIDDINKKLA